MPQHIFKRGDFIMVGDPEVKQELYCIVDEPTPKRYAWIAKVMNGKLDTEMHRVYLGRFVECAYFQLMGRHKRNAAL